MMETGRLRRWLYDRAMAACAPFADKPRTQWTGSDRLRLPLRTG